LLGIDPIHRLVVPRVHLRPTATKDVITRRPVAFSTVPAGGRDQFWGDLNTHPHGLKLVIPVVLGIGFLVGGVVELLRNRTQIRHQ
jgi:hypothetical protein